MRRKAWKIRRAEMGSVLLESLLSVGWEPFAVTADSENIEWVWLRRKS